MGRAKDPVTGCSDMEESYAQALLVHSNQSDALRASLYKTDVMNLESINRQASDILARPHVRGRFEALKEKRSKRLNIDADYVLRRLTEIDQMDVMDIIEEDLSIKPISEWPKCWRITISNIEVVESISGHGEDAIRNLIKKLKIPDKVKNLELIGRHVNVQAWKDKQELSGTLGLSGILAEIDGSTKDLPK